MPNSSSLATSLKSLLENNFTAASGIVIALFAVYAATAPPTVTLEDDGLFITAALDAGVGHPPGYPVFLFLGHLFSWLPMGTPAWRLHLLSGLLGALACGFLYLTGRRVNLPVWASAVAALSWGLSEHFWSQAIITEVYTLNALLCFATFYFCLSANDNGKLNIKSLNLAALCFGLGLANHWPLMILALPGFMTLMLMNNGWQIIRRLPQTVFIALLAAAIFYVWMVWRSHTAEMTFYGPINSLKDFWFFMSREGYSAVEFSQTATVTDRLLYLWFVIKQLATQITLAGAALAVFGIRAAGKNKKTGVLFASLAIIFGHSIALVWLRNVDYDELQTSVFRPYSITAYGFWALFMVYGLAAVKDRLKNRNMAGLARFAPLFAVLIPAFLLTSNLRVNDRSEDRFAGEYARIVLDTLPPNAVFFVHGDTDSGPLGYMRFAENMRPDVELINLQGLLYANRLFHPVKDKKSVRRERLSDYIKQSSRPLFLEARNSLDSLPEGFSVVHYGLYQNIARSPQKGTIKIIINPKIISYLQSIEKYGRSPDTWIRNTHSKIMHRTGHWLGYATIASSPGLTSPLETLKKTVMKYYHGIIGIAEVLIQHGGPQNLLETDQLLETAEPLMEKKFGKERVGRFYYLKGFLAHRLGRPTEARRHFRTSADIYPHKNNASIGALRQLR